MASDAYTLNPDMLVGGQAVLEGVMMRSARGYAVAVRRPDRTLVFDRDEIQAPSAKFRPLKWPVLRGSTILIQSLLLGFRALSFAAHHSVPESSRPEGSADRASRAAIAASLAVAVLFGLGLFLFLPLLLTNLVKARFSRASARSPSTPSTAGSGFFSSSGISPRSRGWPTSAGYSNTTEPSTRWSTPSRREKT